MLATSSLVGKIANLPGCPKRAAANLRVRARPKVPVKVTANPMLPAVPGMTIAGPLLRMAIGPEIGSGTIGIRGTRGTDTAATAMPRGHLISTIVVSVRVTSTV